jgi:hypothetical protein
MRQWAKAACSNGVYTGCTWTFGLSSQRANRRVRLAAFWGPTLDRFTPAGDAHLLAEAEPDDSPSQGHQPPDITPGGTGDVRQKGVHQGAEQLTTVGHGGLRNKGLGGYYTVMLKSWLLRIKWLNLSVNQPIA